MSRFLFLSFLLATGIFMTACQSDDEAPLDTFAPVVTINSPSNGDTFAAGDTMVLSITLSEDVSLKSMNISSNLGINEDFTTFNSKTTHNQEFNLTIDSNTVTGLYDITVSAIDDSDNTGERTIDITIL